jgi:hypothetical protein
MSYAQDQDPTFTDELYDWMERAPWLALSVTFHALILLVLALIPWHLFTKEEPVIFEASIDQVEPVEFDEPLPEDPLETETSTEEVIEPTIQETPTADSPLIDELSDFPDEGDPDYISQAPFEAISTNKLLGVGPGGGGKYGLRFKGKPGGGGSKGTRSSLESGIRWLVDHQDLDGKWDADGFSKHDPAHDRCDGLGEGEHDVGVTGLALLALLGDGNTTRDGAHSESVSRGLQWLRTQQDPDSGLFGERLGHSYMYGHAIATLTMCEAYYFSKNPILKSTAQRAVNFISRARNPYGVWRYSSPPDGDQDTSVTGWMVLALRSAKDAGLKVDSAAFGDALAWIDQATDSNTGRVGYDSAGSASSRVRGVNDHFPTDRTECMTAVGLLCRFFLGQDPIEHPVLLRHADLLQEALPEWNPDGMSNDLYYWYYGSYAMYQVGGQHWERWNRAMKKAVLDSQRSDSSARGSWDPIGPWGHAGGRVYSTALGVLCLEVYFRYARILGGR